MKVWIITSLLLCYLLLAVEGFLRFDSVHSETTVFGTVVKYCQYNGMDILPGSIVRNKAKCEEARCTDTGLSVAGFGIKAGVHSVEEGLVVVPDGCAPRIVSLSCPTQTPRLQKPPLVKQLFPNV